MRIFFLDSTHDKENGARRCVFYSSAVEKIRLPAVQKYMFVIRVRHKDKTESSKSYKYNSAPGGVQRSQYIHKGLESIKRSASVPASPEDLLQTLGTSRATRLRNQTIVQRVTIATPCLLPNHCLVTLITRLTRQNDIHFLTKVHGQKTCL